MGSECSLDGNKEFLFGFRSLYATEKNKLTENTLHMEGSEKNNRPEKKNSRKKKLQMEEPKIEEER